MSPFHRVLVAILLLANPAWSATVTVESVADLRARLAAAQPGDVVVVRNGRYATDAALRIERSGTATAPIVVRAESVGGVEFAGTHGFAVTAAASHVVIEGFVFTHAAGGNTVAAGAHHVRWLRNAFACPGEGADLDVAGDDVEVARNEFRGKQVVGNMLSVTGAGEQVARRLWVHHNHFHDYAKAGGNGAETIRFGRSWLSMSAGDGLVEHNLFVRCVGENELITNKSGANTYRYNTFLDSPGAQLTLRHGNDCRAYGNYFRNTDGLRVFGDRHRIYGNYFEGNTKGIDMGNGDGEVADGAKLTCHDRPDDCVVAFNTFVNNRVHYQMGGRTNGLGAARVTVTGNVMVGGDIAVSLSPTAPHTATWSGNIWWGAKQGGNLPAEGFVQSDPKLVPDNAGVLRPAPGGRSTGSPAGKQDVTALTGMEPYTGQPLTPADVGPASGR
ncbi:MAG TPA: polysaccharide lyase 6 family protein [Lacunisphaera sp.]|nr:polysaccharide lyase 6 family protein [Lacunisphaera sp.]